jgi:hypothetical protein
MGPTAAGQTVATMDDKLAAYWEIVEKRDALEGRLRKAESEKASVSPRIYEKVTAEYERELRAISERLEPVKSALDDARKDVERSIEEIDRSARAIAEELSEATFRHRVGEFTTEQYQAVVDKHRPEVESLRKRRAEYETQLDAFDRRRHRESAAPSAAPEFPPIPEPPAPEPPAAAKPAPERAPETPPAQTEAPDYVDPSNWFDDNNSSSAESAEPKKKASGSPASKRKDDDDPLAALADPSDNTDRAGTYPSLLIKTGAHAGRVLPLLPMTMSIGREHDNNIELKDPEVARYHARIVYERGQFAIEDLESSTGTFINGQRTRRAQLAEGDLIRVGTTELAITYES